MNYTALNDQTLIDLIAQTEPDALNELYIRYSRLIFSLALNIVGNQATAEEITIDVFTRVWEKAHTFQPGRSKVSTWLTSMARYRAIDYLRREKTRLEHTSLRWAEITPGSMPHANANPEHALELTLMQERIRFAVAQLPSNQREALALAYFKGYSHQQIAEALNQPLGTIKTRIRSAMKRLRQLLQDEQTNG